jgi:very-short-patch-repair endonuclease
MGEFVHNLDELFAYLTTKKYRLTSHLTKNYKENIHYIVKKDELKNVKKHGGQNKIDYLLTKDAFELLKNSYNLRNRYIVNLSENATHVNAFAMCIENQTIGFIQNAYSKMFNVKRQFIFGKYRVDLYFIDHKLVIECDENNHVDRDATREKTREEYLLSLGNKIIRYNPNDKSFDLSNVLSDINAVLFSEKK